MRSSGGRGKGEQAFGENWFIEFAGDVNGFATSCLIVL